MAIGQKIAVVMATEKNVPGGIPVLDEECKLPVEAIPEPAVTEQIEAHNTNTESHTYIRNLITDLTTRLNTLADSDDTTLDQLSEIVAYIKSNKTLIESVTTNKINVLDIIDNLTTDKSDVPLSAAQGVVLKQLIDDLANAIPEGGNAEFNTFTGTREEYEAEKDNIEEGTYVNIIDDESVSGIPVASEGIIGGVLSGGDIDVDTLGNVTVNSVNGKSVGTNVPENAVFTDTQADWNETDTTSSAYIKNKPTINNVEIADWAKAESKPTYTADEVGADPTGSANTALTEAKEYTNNKIDALVGEGAAETLDTIGEISKAIENNQDMLGTLNDAIGNKANSSDVTNHTSSTSNPHNVTAEQIGLGNVENKSSATIRGEITKANVTTALGYTPPESDTTYNAATSSALGLVKIGSNITNTNGTISISKSDVANALGYTPPTSNVATTSAKGLMSAEMVTKLNGVAEGANAYTHPNSGATAGTYRSVTVNAQGHVTAGSNPTITVAQGGTGATTAKGAEYNILKDIPESTAALTDNALFVFKKTTPNSTDGVFVWKYASLIWNYIKDKISSVLGLTATQYNGNAKTATTATNATKVNNLTVETAVPANAKFTDTVYSPKKSTVTLSASGWSSNSQTVSVSSVTADNIVIIAPNPNIQDVYAEAGIKCTAQTSGKLTFTCKTVPTVDITVNIVTL